MTIFIIIHSISFFIGALFLIVAFGDCGYENILCDLLPRKIDVVLEILRPFPEIFLLLILPELWCLIYIGLKCYEIYYELKG